MDSVKDEELTLFIFFQNLESETSSGSQTPNYLTATQMNLMDPVKDVAKNSSCLPGLGGTPAARLGESASKEKRRLAGTYSSGSYLRQISPWCLASASIQPRTKLQGMGVMRTILLSSGLEGIAELEPRKASRPSTAAKNVERTCCKHNRRCKTTCLTL